MDGEDTGSELIEKSSDGKVRTRRTASLDLKICEPTMLPTQ